jgi:hypothetical protein
MDLGTPRLSWRRLGVLIRHLPRGSALHRELDPEGYDWDRPTDLLANILDVEVFALWQRSGGKGAKPKPIPRPRVPGQGLSWDEKVALYEEHKRERARELEVMANGG